ncbi:TetR/AcrR family transcriptional regulator [Amorphus sp. 3PC139-8]|uniref:TetR/AcrR family transcriptional regulator n=1 Tax=Amorphus sp. 3PC139-8 TaxID=2735676 RepID=UPI00345C931F
MPQIKKQAVADAILRGASRLFRERGYSGTSMAEIARAADTSTSNIYVYFLSKLDILFAIYQPWLDEHFLKLERDLEQISEPANRLEHILLTLWRDLPAADNGFANNMMQALSTACPNERYDPGLLQWMVKRVSALVRTALPSEHAGLAEDDDLAQILVMTFEGFSMNRQLPGTAPTIDPAVRLMVGLLLGDAASSGSRIQPVQVTSIR